MRRACGFERMRRAIRRTILAVSLSVLSISSLEADAAPAPLLDLRFDSDLMGVDGERPTRDAGAAITAHDGGIEGNAVQLDQGASLAYPGTPDNFDPNHGTLEFWFNANTWMMQPQLMRVFFRAGTECLTYSGCVNGITLDFDTYNGRIRFTIDDYQGPFSFDAPRKSISYPYTPATMPLNTLHHLAVTWDGGAGARLFLDGAEVASLAEPFVLGAPNSDLVFSDPSDTPFGKITPGAKIDNLRIHGYARSAEEIRATYEGLKDPRLEFDPADGSLGFRVSAARPVGTLLDQIDAGIAGFDGGYSFLHDGRAFWSFGDTALSNGGLVIGNTFAETSDLDASDGIRLAFRKDADGTPLDPHPDAVQGEESAAWATMMVEKDGYLYESFSAVRFDPVEWVVFLGQGLLRSTRPLAAITDANDVELVRTDAFWPVDAAGAPQEPGVPFHSDGKYVYLDSTVPGTNELAILSRVKREDLEDKRAYTYWTGKYWSRNRSDAVNILPDDGYRENVTLLTIERNAYLGKWLIVHSAGEKGNLIVARVADHITGPWSPAKILARCPPYYSACNFAHLHPEYDRDGGRILYLTYSNWQRYKVYLLELVLQGL
jgi:hypothetical protein